jgi:hypothetical protein
MKKNFPPELLAQLRISKRSYVIREVIQKVISSKKEPSSIDDVLIGIYAMTGDILKRPNVCMYCHQLVKLGKLKKAAKGLFQLP